MIGIQNLSRDWISNAICKMAKWPKTIFAQFSSKSGDEQFLSRQTELDVVFLAAELCLTYTCRILYYEHHFKTSR